jgi:hypothetical protein
MLLQQLNEERKHATSDADLRFSTDFTKEQLDEKAKKDGLEHRHDNKYELAQFYRWQFVNKRLIHRRQSYMKTKQKADLFKIFLPWYRVLFASFRRIEYMSLKKTEPEAEGAGDEEDEEEEEV